MPKRPTTGTARRVVRKPAVAFAVIGALTLVGLRVLVRQQHGRWP
jgi:hypothetical protein